MTQGYDKTYVQDFIQVAHYKSISLESDNFLNSLASIYDKGQLPYIIVLHSIYIYIYIYIYVSNYLLFLSELKMY